ncbi:MAG TPA: toast rack family protein [Anaerolineaceae bacterium]|nr:toast rack family protein [Anaerolineaceae bacterium]HPN50912.1 toast rack family protein [Anaerolineaceae bacterium]
MKRPLWIVLIVLMLTSMACSITINTPKLVTGETKTVTLDQALGNDKQVRLNLRMGAGKMEVEPGSEKLLTGTIKYNVPGWEPKITRGTDLLMVEQGSMENITGLPSDDVVNEWSLAINKNVPIKLMVDAGAYQGKLDLSGLSIVEMRFNDGASQVEINFDEPNPVVMENLEYKTGASEVKLIGLANANFDRMRFEGGMGSYTFDFSGKLTRDAEVTVKSAASNIVIIIPEGLHAKIINKGAVSSISTEGAWLVKDNTYEATGEGPLLTITLDTGVSNMELRHE